MTTKLWIALALTSCSMALAFPIAAQQQLQAKILNERHEFTQAPDGSYHHRWSRKLQVLDLGALDAYADVVIPYNVDADEVIVHKAVTTNSQGQEIASPATALNHTLSGEVADYPAFNSHRNLTVSFIGVDVGSILEFDVETITAQPVSPWLIERVYLARDVYVESLEIVMAIGLDSKPRWHIFGADNVAPQPQITMDSMRETWTFKSIEPVHYESTMGPYRLKLPVIYLSTCPSWELLVQDFHDTFFPKIIPIEALTKQVDDLVKDAVSPADRLQAIYDYCSANFHRIELPDRVFHYETRPLEQVWLTMYGPKLEQALLFAAMLNHLGGQTALLFGNHQDRVTEQAPGFDFFDTILVEATLDNERWVLDFDAGPETWGKWHTADYVFLRVWSESGSKLKSKKFLLTSSVQDSAAPASGAQAPFTWLRYGPSDANQNTARYVVNLQPDKEKPEVFSGALYAELKGWCSPYHRIRVDTKAYVEKLLNGFLAEPAMDSFSILYLSPDVCTVECKFSGKLKTADLEKNIVQWQFQTSGVLESAIPQPLPGARLQDFVTKAAISEVIEIKLTVPDEWELGFKPNDVEMQLELGSVNAKCIFENKLLTWQRSVIIPITSVSPSKYDEFCSLIQTVRAPHSTVAVFIKNGDGGSGF